MILSIALFVVTLGLSLAAMAKLKSTYARYSQVPTSAGYTGAQVAARILQAAGIHDVEIAAEPSKLGDHYDPIHKRLVLSEENYNGTSIAAVGVAAHECGHAVQHKIAYAPLQWRMAAIGATNFANGAVMLIPFLGLFTGLAPRTMMLWMAIAWGVIMLFQLITLPVEFDASRRAKLILGQMGFVQSGEEAAGVNKVLNTAGLTYVAAFVTSLAYFLYYLLPLLLGNRSQE